MLIDCDTCTVRGAGCDDCVVTVLLGAPPGWRESQPTVVPLTRRGGAAVDLGTGAGNRVAPAAVSGGGAGSDAPGRAAAGGDLSRVDSDGEVRRPLVELDDVERRAVCALADFGLVPPLRHQDASIPIRRNDGHEERHVS